MIGPARDMPHMKRNRMALCAWTPVELLVRQSVHKREDTLMGLTIGVDDNGCWREDHSCSPYVNSEICSRRSRRSSMRSSGRLALPPFAAPTLENSETLKVNIPFV